MAPLSNFYLRAYRAVIKAKETSEWWSSQTPEQQSDYISKHPNSKFAKDAKEKAEAPTEPKPDAEAPKPDADKPSSAKQLTPAAKDPAQWPAHVQALKLPPAWTDVKYSEDPNANLQAVGKDAKGRSQYVYSEAFSKSQAALKFSRVLELDSQFNNIETQNNSYITSKDPSKKAHGECLSLIMKMGLRPGSTEDTGAEKQAYGATTLSADHVVVKDGKVSLKFTGKKGVDLNLPVDDPELAKMLVRRKKSAGAGGKLFPEVSAESLSAHTQSLNPGGFKTKDMRTRLGTKTANDLVASMEPPKNMAEYKKSVKEIATKVSQKLGNTPLIAMQSYIAPQVFSIWQNGLQGS